MTGPIAVLDEATLRRIVGEELDARFTPVIVAIGRTTRHPDAPRLLDRAQLAAVLQVDPRTLRRLEREGALPRPARIGGRIERWLWSDIERWLESGAPPLPARRRAGSCVTNGDRTSS